MDHVSEIKLMYVCMFTIISTYQRAVDWTDYFLVFHRT